MRYLPALARFCALVLLWMAAFKAADIFGFFKTYSSLWFLPAGVTIAVVLATSGWFRLAPLVANLLMAIPAVCWALGVPFTNSREPVLHALRIYAEYGGVALLLAHTIKVGRPMISLHDTQWVLGLSVMAACLAAVSGVSLHVAVGNLDWTTAWSIVVPWAAGDAIGAIIVPPLLVPLLAGVFGTPTTGWEWPSVASWLAQGVAIVGALAIGMLVPQLNPELGSLWYLIIIPPVFFALRGGLHAAATSVFMTSMLAPPAAYLFDYQGERLGLQLLLLLSSIAGLLVGAAISDRKRAFGELERQQSVLEQVVAARTRALEEAYAFQRHLVRSLGHDLRQPVQSMNMMLDGLVVQNADGTLAPALQQTRDIGTAASELLSKILSYAKSDVGKVKPELAAFPASRLLNELSLIYAQKAHELGVELIVAPSDEVVVSDEPLLMQVMSNYVDNAIRLSSPGQSVTVSCSRGDQGTVFTVRDQVSTPPADRSGAAGFGLEIVRHVASLLDAELVTAPNVRGICLRQPSRCEEGIADPNRGSSSPQHRPA